MTNVVDDTAYSSTSKPLRMKTTMVDGQTFSALKHRDFSSGHKTQSLPTPLAFDDPAGGDPIAFSSRSFT